jgi:hypothetical protein
MVCAAAVAAIQAHNDANGQTGGERRTLLPIVSNQNRQAPSLGDAQRWSNPATWGGQVPGPNSAVVIPAGKTVLFDVDATVKNLTINGALVFEDIKDLNLSADWIIVNGPRGWLSIGEEGKPHTRRATLTLTARDPNENVFGEAPMNMGTKFLGAMGGVIELHGASGQKTSWTQLNASVAPGATRLTLAAAPGWTVGDQIVVAPSGFEPAEAEVVTVTAISGADVTVSPALKYAHWGVLQTYDGKTLDQRAEVGLLTRNIIVQGDAASDAGVDASYGYRRGFGGHGMFMPGSRVRISGALFRNMGQTGKKGRYPIHFHFGADMNGSYVRNSTIRDSFHRGIVVHKTNRMLVEDNVTYNIASHAYVPSEDGDEKFNTFNRNLAVLTRRLSEADFAFPQPETVILPSSQAEHRAGAFWMRNFVGTFRGNHVAGVLGGMGFFFDRFSVGAPSEDPEPMIFEDNTVHTVVRPGGGGLNAETYPEATFGQGLMVSDGTGRVQRVFKRTTAYKNFGGIWAEDRAMVVSDTIAADNGAGVFVLRGVLDGVTVIGQSANTLGQRPRSEASVDAGIVLPPSHGGTRAPIIRDAVVINQPGKAIGMEVYDVGEDARVEKLRLINTPLGLKMQPNEYFLYGGDESAFDDPNGQIVGDGRAVRWVQKHSPLVTQACGWHDAVAGYACPMSESLKVTIPGDQRMEEAIAANGEVLYWLTPQYMDVALPDWRTNAFAHVRDGAAYQLLWSVAPTTSLSMVLDESVGKSVTFWLPASAAPSQMTQNGAPVAAAADRAALAASAASAWYFDSASRTLYVRLVGGASAQRIEINAPFLPNGPAGRAAAAPGATAPGLAYAYYEGSWPVSPRFDLRASAPVSQGVVASMSPIPFARRAQDFGVVYTGYLNVPADGGYLLYTSTEGDAQLTIGDKWVTGATGCGSFVGPVICDAGLISLRAGLHPITVQYVRRPNAGRQEPRVLLYWKREGEQGDPVQIPASAYVRTAP